MIFYALFFLFLSAPDSAHWYQLKLAGQPVGYVVLEVGEQDGIQKHGFAMHMELNRMGRKLEMSLNATSTETSGVLSSLEIEQKLSSQVQKKQVVFLDDTIEITDKTAGKSFTNKIPYSGPVLGFHGIQAESRKQLRRAGDSFTYQTFSGELAMLMRITRTFKGKEKVRMNGQEKWLLLVEESSDKLPSIKKLWMDDSYFPLRMIDQTPFGEAESMIADRKTATAKVTEDLPNEIFDGTMIRSNWRLKNPRAIDVMTLKITLKDESMGFPEFRRENQTVVKQNARETILKISRPSFEKGISAKPGKEFTTANALVDSDHPAIKRVARRLKTDQGDIAQVMKYKNWVSENMGFDLGVLMAPASEIIENKKGTCTEYATLLTALLRAGGYPARFAMGYVYMGGIWGGHAWAEVYLNNHWFPLDAAINSSGFADAGRFSLITSSLANGSTELNGPGLQLYGNSHVDILSFEKGDQLTRVPTDASAYVIKDSRYLNQGLGLDLRVPDGFQIKNASSVWPSRKIVEFLGPNQQKVTISQHYLLPSKMNKQAVWDILEKHVPQGQREERYFLSAPNTAAKAIVDGQDVLIIHTQMPASPEFLRKFLRDNSVN